MGGAGGGGSSAGTLFDELLSKVSLQELVAFVLISQAIQPLLAPYVQELLNTSQFLFPLRPLSPSDLADAVNRGFMTADDASQMAQQSGISTDPFAVMVRLAGLALSPEAAAEALRRGIIPEDSGDPDKPGFIQAIKQGNLRDIWAPVIRALAVQWPSPSDALDALLEGQVDRATALALYQKFGGDPDYFQMLFDTRGSAPTPVEASVMANRGIIPWDGTGPEATSFRQAFLEGPWRDKWLEPFRAMAAYLPPPRTITAMVRNGSLDSKDATALLVKHGLAPELAAAYIADATHQKTKAAKGLTEAVIVKLYAELLISRQECDDLLRGIGYSAEEATYLLELQDVQRAARALTSAVGRIQTLYSGRKLGRQPAAAALSQLHIPADQAEELLTIWDLERGVNVRVLTPAEIADAWERGVMGQDSAQAELQNLGYTPFDAWVLLSLKNKGPLPDPPAEGMPAGFTVPAGGAGQ